MSTVTRQFHIGGMTCVNCPRRIEKALSGTPGVTDVRVDYSTLEPGGYPSIRVRAGLPMRWIIRAPEGSVNGCNYKMILRDLGQEHEFTAGDNVIEFTAPAEGTIAYSCWMGMLQGYIYVTN